MSKHTYAVNLTLRWEIEADDEELASEIAEVDFKNLYRELTNRNIHIEINGDEMYDAE
jgi:hypothetical protein